MTAPRHPSSSAVYQPVNRAGITRTCPLSACRLVRPIFKGRSGTILPSGSQTASSAVAIRHDNRQHQTTRIARAIGPACTAA
jgi:hypothetical protein